MGGLIPAEVRTRVLRSLKERDGREHPPRIATTAPVGGGCINPSARVVLDDGRDFFLKWNDDEPGMFAAEADGLRALALPQAVRVPEVVAVGHGDDGGPGWLLLEFVPRGASGPGFDQELGEGLARLHDEGLTTSGPEFGDRVLEDPGSSDSPSEGLRWGWPADNWIGSLPQSNQPRVSWSDFWLEERIEPQLRLARDRGRFADSGATTAWRDLFRRAPEMLEPAEKVGPSLLHGDLWSGNVYPDPEGEPVLVDPAVYAGHGEVDLAMTELFGGFGSDFYRRYREIRRIPPGYREIRRHLYQLYPLLVHVNLFGGGYEGQSLRTLRSALRGWG